jgi:glycerol-3-phosphate cytidylyltransferase-like family protein
MPELKRSPSYLSLLSRKSLKHDQGDIIRHVSELIKENWDRTKQPINVHVVIHAIRGKPKETLLKSIDDLFPDLVITGARIRGRLFIGSVSTYLVQNSMVPVLVVRDPTHSKRFMHPQGNISTTSLGYSRSPLHHSIEGDGVPSPLHSPVLSPIQGE